MKRIIFLLVVLFLVGCDNSYKVVFDFQDNTINNEIKNINENKIDKPENPEREGYCFKYWSTSKSGEEFNFNTIIHEDIILYAIWDKCFQVIFKFEDDVIKNIVEGEKVSKPNDNITKEGFTFLYWSLEENGKEFNFDSIIDKDIVLYPVFKEIKFKVTFDLTGGNPIVNNQEISYNNNVEEPDSSNLFKLGYKFKYWSLSVDGEPYDFSNLVNQDLKLFAIWEEDLEDDMIKVFFNTRNADIANYEIKIAKSTKINEPVVTKKDYRFLGWYKDLSFENEYLFNFDNLIEEDTTLYAKWELMYIDKNKAETLINENFEDMSLGSLGSNWKLYQNQYYNYNDVIARVTESDNNKILELQSSGLSKPTYPLYDLPNNKYQPSFILNSEFYYENEKKASLQGKIKIDTRNQSTIEFGISTGSVNAISVVFDDSGIIKVKRGDYFSYFYSKKDYREYIITSHLYEKEKWYEFRFEWDVSNNKIEVFIKNDTNSFESLSYSNTSFNLSNRANADINNIIITPNNFKITMSYNDIGYAYIDDIFMGVE